VGLKVTVKWTPSNVLRLSCKARLVMLASSYPTGRALAAPNAG
jgi:hypothetical protein